MAKLEILLPAMGEGVIEATITKWLVSKGDKVKEDDPIAEVATDKVDSEIPSPWDGTIEKLNFTEGDIPKIGDSLALIVTKGDERDTPLPADKEKEVEKVVEQIKEDIEKTTSEQEENEKTASGLKSRTSSGKFLSPLVRNIANQENISHDELDQIQGTGNDGRITKEDLLGYINKQADGSESEPTVPVPEERPEKKVIAPRSDSVSTTGDEIIEMDRMRKLIAEHMVKSKQISPHVTSFIEADVTNMVNWRNKVKDQFLSREKQKLTFTPLFIEATAKALKDFPGINVSVDGTKIILKSRINIGMATALPNGNLIVPVIKQADEKSLIGLTKSVNDLANRARENKLLPDEITGGTFTITNFGTFQNTTGTPIINQPEVAILGVGAIRKKPAVIETEQGDAIAIRHLMILSLSYDHRVVDGALGGMFLKKIADYLENFDRERSI